MGSIVGRVIECYPPENDYGFKKRRLIELYYDKKCDEVEKICDELIQNKPQTSLILYRRKISCKLRNRLRNLKNYLPKTARLTLV